MSNNKSYCSRNYHYLELDLLDNFALGIKAAYYGNNPPFTDVTITEVAFGLLITTYVNKRGEYVNGGETQKGPFLLAKTALMDGLDSLADKVDLVADGDPDIITLGGYTPTKTGNSEKNKPGQCTVTVKRGIAGELIASCEPVEGAKHYGCLMVEGAPLPGFVVINAAGQIVVDENSFPPEPDPNPFANITAYRIDLTDQRIKHFTNLKHDGVYYFYYFAVNATGVGPLSEVVSMVAW